MRITGRSTAGWVTCVHVAEALPVTVQAGSGCECWPGTLNVDLEGQNELIQGQVIAGLEEVIRGGQASGINGFERDGSHSAEPHFKARLSVDDVGWEDCAILIPDLTRHTSTAEVISGAFLGEASCSDGDIVNIELS